MKSRIAFAVALSLAVALFMTPAFAAAPFKVSSTTPLDGATGVALNSDVTIVWNRDVDCATVDEANITISAGGWTLASCGASQAVFATSAQVPGATYAVNVSTAVADAGGTALKNAYAMSYTVVTVDTVRPSVASTSPADGAVDSPLDGSVTINWDEDVDCTTVSTASVTSDSPGWALAGCGGSQAVFATSGQAYSTLYSVTVGTSVTDLAQNEMAAPYSFSYTTEAEVLIDADTLDGIDSTGFAAAAHAHDPAYVNEGQSDSVSSAMLVAGAVSADKLAPAVEARIAAIEALVAGLQAESAAQQSQIDTLIAENTSQDALISSLNSRVTALESAPQYFLDDYVSLDLNPIDGLAGPHIIFNGANVHVRSGQGSTNSLNGLGNLVIGYNETASAYPVTERNGSHNLVIGEGHQYTAVSGIVTGYANSIGDVGNAVLAGQYNSASRLYATILGGANNIAANLYGNVIGGVQNTNQGMFSSIVSGNGNVITNSGSYGFMGGGTANEVSNNMGVVLGGSSSDATGQQSTVIGSQSSTASGYGAMVSGGSNNAASGSNSSVAGGAGNIADAISASVSGGINNTASAYGATVSGGAGNIASGDNSSVSGGIDNTASGYSSSVTAGQYNIGLGGYSSVTGGQFNEARGPHSSISGGLLNINEVDKMTIGGGNSLFFSAGCIAGWAAGDLFQCN